MVEQPAVNRRVAGSSPASGAIFLKENCEIGSTDTVLTQERAESENEVRFPKRIKYRGRVLATIYRPSKHYRCYRVAWSAAGKRTMKAFPRYGEAKRHADAMAKDLAKGGQVAKLTPGQAADALTALEHLQGFYGATGRKLSLSAVASVFCESAMKLGGHSIAEAVDGFLCSVATVTAKDVAEAVKEFLAGAEQRTKSNDGKRPEVSPKYHYNRAIMLRRFAAAFPATAVKDLTKEHLDAFFAGLGKTKSKANERPVASAKSRNHHRTAVRQFLAWSVRKDFLSATHRLNESDTMTAERANDATVEFYTPAEFKALLETAHGAMRAMLAIGGLTGLRTAELLRLTWEDVRKVEGNIEVTAGKAKTRQRRLVEIVPALAQWLEPFAEFTGKLWTQHENSFQRRLCELCEKTEYETKGGKAKVTRKANGLRHSFCSFHFALHANEGATAQQAGNSPQMIHAHYKGLATKTEAAAWFAVSPEQPGNVLQLGKAATAANQAP